MRRATLTLVPLAAVALGLVAVDRWRAAAAPSPAASRHGLVVLPFANFGGGAQPEHFTDGFTDGLIWKCYDLV